MSEHQLIAFRAIDQPVSEKNLEYMERQSSRAEITPWSFDNEYHYGDFRGNAVEMLRRGYDLHLHYANFGIRKLLIRLPDRLPDSEAARPYFGKESVQFIKDKSGPGGVLCVEPFHEPGDLQELWEIDDLVGRLIPLRSEILAGDLRPLYVAHLAVACDGEHDPEETKEGPLPAGMDRLSSAQLALAELYGLGDSLLAAVAQGGLALAGQADPRNQYAAWVERQPAEAKDRWLVDWLADPHSSARREMLVEFQKSQPSPSWPTTNPDRTIAELMAAAEVIESEAKHKAAANAARQRIKRLAAMAANPGNTLKETEELAKQRSTTAYTKIAKLLAELREALADGEQSGLAEQQAKKLKAKHPTLRSLVSELRREGFLPK